MNVTKVVKRICNVPLLTACEAVRSFLYDKMEIIKSIINKKYN